MQNLNPRLLLVAKSLRDWIDAVPSDTPLPAMPGINRDYVDQVIEEVEKELQPLITELDLDAEITES